MTPAEGSGSGGRLADLAARWPKFALALCIGIVSALIARRLGFPLPWMLGPMIGTTIAAVSGAPIAAPLFVRPFVLPILGVMLGSGFSPNLADLIGGWVVTLALIPAYIIAAGGITYLYFRRVAGYDPITAFYSGMPGGLNEMILMGLAHGGDDRRIALAQALRVLIVVTLVAFAFKMMFGVAVGAGGRAFVAFGDLTVSDVLWLAACAVAGAFLGKWARLPAGQLVGPLALSAVVHLAGLVQTPPPSLVVNTAQIVIGTLIGSRFVGIGAAELGRNIVIGIGAAATMLAVSILFAFAVDALSATEVSQSFLAFSPGGLTEMSLLALAMGQDIVYVSVSHVARVSLVIIIAPIGFRILRLARGPARRGPGT
jgi:hypothetical protein